MKMITTTMTTTTAALLLLLATVNADLDSTRLTSSTSTNNGNNENAVHEYGIDMSFPISSIDALSTNYPWLPHNMNANEDTPEEYKGMPVQILGNRREIYDTYMEGCKEYWGKEFGHRGEGAKACTSFERSRFRHNLDQPHSMVNYTSLGYKKIKAPKDIFKLISNFWRANRHDQEEEEWSDGNSFVNYWDTPSTMVSVSNKNLVGGGSKLHDMIWNVTSDIISEWTGQKLVGSSVYGIRVYKEGAILAPHVDRLPLISSAIINVDQDLDEDWPLEVIGHDGVARNVTMEPGDMILYESHSVLHGRPFALKGRFFANIFIHFMPVPTEEQIKNHALPPYIQENSTVAKQWVRGKFEDEIPGAPHEIMDDRSDENKWGQHEAHTAAGDGDLERLIEIAKEDEHALHYEDHNGWKPIHEAVRSGDEEVIEFLAEQGADLNSRTVNGKGPSVLDIAIESWGDEEDYIDWLRSLGARVTRYNLGPEL